MFYQQLGGIERIKSGGMYATMSDGSAGDRKFAFTACRTLEALWIEAT
jgi:hypothetical protein